MALSTFYAISAKTANKMIKDKEELQRDDTCTNTNFSSFSSSLYQTESIPFFLSGPSNLSNKVNYKICFD